MMRSHGRYPYSAIIDRPAFSWPNGARLAVYIAVNLEVFPFGEGMGVPMANPQPEPDIVNFGWRDWGNRVGVWNLLDALDEAAMPAAALVNAAMYDECPRVVAAFRARGDEVVGHGWSNAERQSTLPEAEERALIAESTQAITQAGYKPPAGWLSPWIAESHVTPDLLAECGYGYSLNWCMDDMPVWKKTRSGRLLSIPYPQEANDIPAIIARKDGVAQFAAMLVDDAMERLDQTKDGIPQVMGIALHPYIIGQPYRMRALRGALQMILAEREHIWLCTAGQIHAHVLSLPEGSIPQ